MVISWVPTKASILVPAWIGSAYFFTSSTSFANPAVTIGRIFTESFAGISSSSALPFIAAQLLGLLLMLLIGSRLVERNS
jgi:arsenate reductase